MQVTDLITGASGFLGRRLAEILRARGENPRLLLRPSSTLGALDPGPGAVVRAAFEDVEALMRVLDGIRRIYHCAGLSSDWGRWADFRAANITAVENLL
ncbi:MAG: NAD-dependent epimerase/dehydratase family protein, partial [Alphaproteobacteria bacterium]|nr:NAD-dependent epimerase/dehydratase family protein [Alphaproteobacteria bacterium]